MKTYLAYEQALEDHQITKVELDRLIDENLVETIVVTVCNNRYMAIYDDDLAAYVADRDITPEKFDHLRGKPIGISEAGLKYQVDPSVISGWVRQGRLKVLDYGPRNKKIIDEAEVAFLAKLGQAKKMRPGKKPFS